MPWILALLLVFVGGFGDGLGDQDCGLWDCWKGFYDNEEFKSEDFDIPKYLSTLR